MDAIRIRTRGVDLEAFRGGTDGDGPVVCAAHPAAAFGVDTVALLAGSAPAGVVCINPRGIGGSTPAGPAPLEQMVDDMEGARGELGLGPWVFWGMSGGGWLAQIYAHRHPQGLRGIIVESACLCFRERLADPGCALSPFFPAWRDALGARGLYAEGSHARPSSGDDTEWIDVAGVGQVFRRRGGPALLVSPLAVDAPMRRAMPILWTFDARAWIGTVRVPTLVIAGSADPVVPLARVRAVHEAVAGSRFFVADGGGHVPTAERRADVAGAVRSFLAARAGGSAIDGHTRTSNGA